MKLNYKFNFGQVVFCKGEALTIKRKVDNYDVPAYAVMENTKVYFESDLSEINTLSEYAPEQSDRDMKREYRSYLQALDDDRYLALSKYSRNLNLLALKDELAPTYGRESEVDKIRTILLRRTKPNPILTGVAGCGKTAIIEELARTFVNYYLNTADRNTPIIYDLSLNSLVSGTKYRGEFEGRLNSILDLLSRNENIVVLIDEIHVINDIGNSEGAASAGQILKPALARGDIRCIGATTTEEYKKYIATDKALARRFSMVNIAPLAGTARTKCIENIVAEYGTYFDIKTDSISASAIENIIDNIIPETVFPDNVIDIIDGTLATAKFRQKKEITISDINTTVSRMTGYLII